MANMVNNHGIGVMTPLIRLFTAILSQGTNSLVHIEVSLCIRIYVDHLEFCPNRRGFPINRNSKHLLIQNG